MSSFLLSISSTIILAAPPWGLAQEKWEIHRSHWWGSLMYKHRFKPGAWWFTWWDVVLFLPTSSKSHSRGHQHLHPSIQHRAWFHTSALTTRHIKVEAQTKQFPTDHSRNQHWRCRGIICASTCPLHQVSYASTAVSNSSAHWDDC